MMKDSQSFKNALQISALYLIVGIIWIYSSDTVIELFSTNVHQISTFQTYKGFFFIVVTSVLLYLLSYRILHERFIEYTQRLNEQKTAQMQLAYQDALLRTIVNSSPDAIFVKDLEGKYLLFNKGAGEIVGMPPEKVIGNSDTLIFSSETAKKIYELDRSIISGAKILTNEEHLTTAEGKEKVFWVTKGPLFDEKGEVFGIFGISRDITEQKSSQIRLEKQNSLLTSLINSSPDAIVIKGLDQRYIVFNQGASKFSGVKSSDAVGKTADELFPLPTANIINTIDDNLLASNSFIEHEEQMLMPNGKTYIFWVTKGLLKTDSGEIFGIFGIYRDITEARKNEEEILNAKEHFDYLAHHDPLTNLPNRLSLIEILHEKSTTIPQIPFALMFLDLDGFKEINDSFGHRFGDHVLILFSKLLQDLFPKDTLIIRTGGDEFILLIESKVDHYSIKMQIKRLIQTLNEPFIIDQIEVYITTSIGIAFYPDDGSNAEALLQKADAAMYKAKSLGRNTYNFYNEGLTQEVLERTTLTSNLKKALANCELILYYQPQINPHSGKIIGAEALTRWISDGKMIPPSLFIPLAEERGLIIELGNFVLEEGFKTAVEWMNKGILSGRIAINVSAKQLIHQNFLFQLEQLLYKTGCNPEWIELEITESSILENPEKMIALLGIIKSKGFHISIDDFGTGYSSLSYLKNLPIDKLKIDISFIRNITMEPKNQTIVNTIIALAKGLGMTTIAEGVESIEEMEFLRLSGVDSIQGYYYYKPMACEAIEQLLNTSQV